MTQTPQEARIIAQMAFIPPMGKPRNHADEIANILAEEEQRRERERLGLIEYELGSG